MNKIILGFLIVLSSSMAAELGMVPTLVTIKDKNGGRTDGKPWSSSMLKGKVHILFYVDPDKKDLNDPLADALKAKKYDRKKVNSVVIVNLAATWLPNIVVEAKLKKVQKKYPRTIYVKDKKKILVKKWNLADNNSDVLIFDKKGKLIYKKFGKVSADEIKDVIALIEKNR